MHIDLREKIENDIFDYSQLLAALSEYANPRMKINRLLTAGSLIRLKKGLYTFPDYLRRHPLEPGIVANMLYGPSYVSCDYALAFYGMIPESVQRVTSMTVARSRSFHSPVGGFDYFQHKTPDYAVGINQQETASGVYLLASKEKALYDKVLTDTRYTGTDTGKYLMEDLRIEEDILSELQPGAWRELAPFAVGRMKCFIDDMLSGVVR